MACGINRECIEQGIRSTFERIEKQNGGDFKRIEAQLAAAAGRTANGIIERDEVDAFIKISGTTEGKGWVHQRVVSGALNQLDRNRDGAITMQEWHARQR